MGLIGEVTFINQNSHIPSIVMADAMAREKISDELKKQIAEEKRDVVEDIRDVEESSGIDTNISKDAEREREKDLADNREKIKKHIDLKG